MTGDDRALGGDKCFFFSFKLFESVQAPANCQRTYISRFRPFSHVAIMIICRKKIRDATFPTFVKDFLLFSDLSLKSKRKYLTSL